MNVLFIGSKNVGKTSLITSYSNKNIYENTIGVSFYSILMRSKYDNLKLVKINEIEGYKHWNVYLDDYISLSDVVFVVYDITRYETFNYAKCLIKSINKHDIQIVLVGNKSDLSHMRKVKIFDVNKYLSECFNDGKVLFHVETSLNNIDSFHRTFNKFCAPPTTEYESVNLLNSMTKEEFTIKNITQNTATKKNFIESFFELW